MKSDREVAQLRKTLRINIAIDLNGHTQHARLGILALRPAPIQVSYLGFPATTGADFIEIRCPIMRTSQRAMRCGPGFRC